MRKRILAFTCVLLVVPCVAEAITPSPYWKNQIVFPDDPFCSEGVFENDPRWVKFTIKLDDPCTVYFQDGQEYLFHYDFATEWLEPFIDMNVPEFFDVTLYQSGQLGVLGAVILPPMEGNPPSPEFDEYGIQFIRYDPYSKEEIAAMFDVVKSSVTADPGITAYYFPTYEQASSAEADRAWLLSQGVPIGSVAQWFEGNVCYSPGWALGELKFFGADDIEDAYQNGLLEPNDILLTDGVPAEIPFVAGILSLSPSTPSSHVAILARTYNVPFAYLAIAEDANNAQQLTGRTVLLCVDEEASVSDVGLRDVEDLLTEEEIEAILTLKTPPPLDISPMAPYGAYSGDTNDISPSDIGYFGGKASNYGILRDAIESNCPNAMAVSFDLWNEFLDQALVPRESIIIESGGYLLFWADNDEVQGPNHTNFKLSNDGEYVGLYDTDGTTLIDGLTFGAQSSDVSYGRSPDGNDNWVPFSGGTATPGTSNTGSGGPTSGLFINEFMADNDSTIQDPDGSGYPDWIELYNAGPSAIDLGGMYLTDDASDPTKWMIPVGISGGALREEIANRLTSYSYPPVDMAGLSADLSAIRSLFKSSVSTSFTQLQKDAIIAALQGPNYGFDVNSKIRFRSSTNVEDSERFTGAGLYDSYSGCLADDLDGNDNGPCICDANKSNERGVFRAIRKVYASFYNDNAFLERLRYGVNPTQVGMALLVHHSFPDEFELANGVATLEKNSSGPDKVVKLVTQKGAISVANPDDSSIPEEVEVYVDGAGVKTLTLVRGSSLVILGDTVMDWLTDYNDLTELLLDVSVEFENVTGKNDYILDFEYKKLSAGGAAMPAGGLVIKQVREIPQPADTPSITTPLLINEPTEYCTFQGELGDDVFANHRLKSRWTLETKNLWLTPENLEQSLYADAHLEYAVGGRIRTLSETLPLWPFAYQAFYETPPTWPYYPCTIDGWLMHHLQNTRACELRTDNVPTQVSPTESPLVTLSNFGFIPGSLSLSVEYDEPVPSVDYWGSPTTTTTDEILLCPCPQPQPEDLLQERTFEGPNGVSISTSFYWPPPPDGPIGGYTAPLARWVETVITGYTSEPIVLYGYYSQTYRPEHHNFSEHFLFEPRLEPGISQNILDELRAQNIRLIYKHHIVSITTYGFEDESFIAGDFEPDGDVDFVDFSLFAKRWLDTVCDACDGADLTGDGQVMLDDLAEFTDNWLAGVE